MCTLCFPSTSGGAARWNWPGRWWDYVIRQLEWYRSDSIVLAQWFFFDVIVKTLRHSLQRRSLIWPCTSHMHYKHFAELLSISASSVCYHLIFNKMLWNSLRLYFSSVRNSVLSHRTHSGVTCSHFIFGFSGETHTAIKEWIHKLRNSQQIVEYLLCITLSYARHWGYRDEMYHVQLTITGDKDT